MRWTADVVDGESVSSAALPTRTLRTTVTGAAAVDGPPEAVAPEPDARSIGPSAPCADLVGLLVSCLLVVVAFSPVLFGGRTLSTASKTYGTNGTAPFPGQPEAGLVEPTSGPTQARPRGQSEPWAEVTHRAYADGEIPLWNPYQGAGAPLAANMQSEVFDPLLLAVNLHPTPLTWDLSIIGAFVLGAAAAYLFGRVLGLHVVPAVVSSAAFSLSGWFFLYSNNPFSRSYVFLPLLFLLVELVLRSRRLLPVLGLGVAVAGNLYVGMPEASVLVIGSRRRLCHRAARPGAPADATPASLVRLGGAGLLGRDARSAARPPVPAVRAPVVQRPQAGLGQWVADGSALGSSQLARSRIFQDAPSAWARRPELVRRRSRDRGARRRSRVARRRSDSTPGCSSRSARPFSSRSTSSACSTGSAGCRSSSRSSSRCSRRPSPRSRSRCSRGSAFRCCGVATSDLRRFLTLLAASSVLLLVFVRTGDRWSVITSAPRDYAAAVWGRAAFFAALAIAAVVLGAWLGRRWAPLLLAVVIVAELFVLAPFSHLREASRPVLPAGWMTLRADRSRAEPHSRVFGLDGKLYPNTAGALGLQDIRALDALYVERYWRYVKTFIAPAGSIGSRGRSCRCTFRDNPMFDALSVRAVLSQHDLANGAGASAGRPRSRTRASTRTRTPIHGPGSYTTSTSSQAKTTRSRFSRRMPVAGTARSSWMRSTPAPRPSSSATGRPRTTPCARCRTGGRDAARETATGRASSTTPETP